MLRTQISLTSEERALLDAESSRTGRSMSALIREAVQARYGAGDGHEARREADLAALDASAGAWGERDYDGEQWVERLRSGARWADVLDR